MMKAIKIRANDQMILMIVFHSKVLLLCDYKWAHGGLSSKWAKISLVDFQTGQFGFD